MGSIAINVSKEAAVTYQPLFLIDFLWPDSSTLSVCTHAVTRGGTSYLARVMAEQVDTTQALSPTGIDIPPNVKITLADADKSMWNIESTKKFRGARMTVTFAFYDFATSTWSSDAVIPFVGRCGRPQVTEETLVVSASYILALQAVSLPQFPIQVQCPKIKPLTAVEVALAQVWGSPYFACGSPTTVDCGHIKTGCAAQNNPLNFGGIIYEVPPASRSEAYSTGQWLSTLISDPCDTKYGDFAPIGYGTAWVNCLNLGTFPDANSTRGEAIVCQGLVPNIIQVVVAGEILPAATDITGTIQYPVADPLFRYNVISQGGRTGALNNDTPWNGQGDPHGSLCVIEWVVYNLIASSTPSIQALIEFPQVMGYQAIASVASGVVTLPAGVPNTNIAGNPPYSVQIIGNSNPALNTTWSLSSWAWGPPGTVTLSGTTASGTGGFIGALVDSSDYAWAIFDLLLRAGAALADLDIQSFVNASSSFAQMVPYTIAQNKAYSSEITYNAGDVVLYAADGQYYISLADGNLNNVPNLEFVLFGAGFSGNTGWWALTTAQPTTSTTTSVHARYTCSVVVRGRRTAADLIGGMLRGCNSHLGRNLTTGQLALVPHGTIAAQQPTLPDGSNYSTAVNGGHVAYAFDETSMARDKNDRSTFQRAARAGAGVPNIVTIGFSNEDNDYSGDSVQVPNTADITLMGQQIQGSLTVDGCNALDRANRLGSIYLSEQLSGDLWEWVTTAKAVKLSVGQIVLVSSTKYGFTLQLFRITGIAPEMNWRTSKITANIHNDAWYADNLAVTGSASGTKRDSLPRLPWPWCPNAVAPQASDSLYGPTAYTFGLQISYAQTDTDGTPNPVALITGVEPVNNPSTGLRPPVLAQQGDTASTGGALAGSGTAYWVAAASTDANGLPGPVSTPCQIVVDQSGNTNTATAQVWFWDPTGTGWNVYAGKNPTKLTKQPSLCGTSGTPPQAIVLTALVGPGEGQPDIEFDQLQVTPRFIPHCGPWANTVTVGTGTFSITGAGWTTNQWQGYDCILLAKASGVALPVMTFHVTSSNATTLTVTPDPAAAGLVTGDLIGMLPKPTVSGLKLTDANWVNTLGGAGAGLPVHGDKGRFLRFIAGKGTGYRYQIADNDATSHTAVGPWVVTPDSTSRYVIEDTMPLPGLLSGSVPNNSDPTTPISLSVPVGNYSGEVLSFEVGTVDGGGNQSASQGNPYRMTWFPGSQGTRTITASATMLGTDRLVNAVITAPATYTLLAPTQVPNQDFVVSNDITSTANLTIAAASGFAFNDGTTTAVLTPGSALPFTANPY